jgi:hypothetical protein
MLGCASAPSGSSGLPPYTLAVSASPDSALRLFRLALAAEHLPADGVGTDAVYSVLSTFTVRRGGVGEAEIIVGARAYAEPALPQGGVSSILEINATARERRGMIAMSPEEARSPVGMSRDHHAINPNDREVLGILGRVLDRLTAAGAVSGRRAPPVP